MADLADLMDENSVRLEVEVIKMHDASMLVEYEGEQEWIPYSLIEEESEITEFSEEGDEGDLVIPRWKAEDVGFV